MSANKRSNGHCTLPTEPSTTAAILDEIHQPYVPPKDHTKYTLEGSGALMLQSPVCPTAKSALLQPAVTVAVQLLTTLSHYSRFDAGDYRGIPSDDMDICPGEIFGSKPTSNHGGLCNMTRGKLLGVTKFQRTGMFPPLQLLLKLIMYGTMVTNAPQV